MNISMERDNSKLIIKLEGRLDTTTAPEFEREFLSNLAGVDELILDMDKLVYVSSAGLRTILLAKKSIANIKGTMTVKNVCDTIREVFDMTGFSQILNIQ